MAQSRYFHPNYGRRGTRQQSDDVARGLAAGTGIGKALQGLGGAIGGAIQQSKQDVVANQLMNAAPTATANAQALADPDPDPNPDGTDNLAPTAATDPSGTADPTPFTGGTAEMALRMNAAKQQLGIQDLQAQIDQRNAAAALSGAKLTGKPGASGLNVTGGSASRWSQGGGGPAATGGPRGGATAKTPAYQPNSGDVQNDEGTDNFSQIASDFDNTYGTKGLYSKFATNLTNLQPDKTGNFSLPGKDGTPIATIPASDAPTWIQRTNAARVKSGLSPIGSVGGVPTVGTGQNPTSSAAPGTATNPVTAQSQLHVRSLPFGTYVYDPNTQKTFIKQKPSGQ